MHIDVVGRTLLEEKTAETIDQKIVSVIALVISKMQTVALYNSHHSA